jgi:hypothetical protein
VQENALAEAVVPCAEAGDLRLPFAMEEAAQLDFVHRLGLVVLLRRWQLVLAVHNVFFSNFHRGGGGGSPPEFLFEKWAGPSILQQRDSGTERETSERKRQGLAPQR